MSINNILTILFLSALLFACSSDDDYHVSDLIIEEVMEKMLGSYQIYKHRLNYTGDWSTVNKDDFMFINITHRFSDSEGRIPTAFFNLPDDRSLKHDDFFVNNEYNIKLKENEIVIPVPEKFDGDTLNIKLIYPNPKNRVAEYLVIKRKE